MENLKFQIADSEKRLMAPIATKTGEGKALTLSVPGAAVDSSVVITVKSGTQGSVRSDHPGGWEQHRQHRLARDRSATRRIRRGTFDVIAKKSGYNDAKGSLVVRTAEEASDGGCAGAGECHFGQPAHQ